MAASVQDSLKNDQQNPASPYYLHPGENPGMVYILMEQIIIHGAEQ